MHEALCSFPSTENNNSDNNNYHNHNVDPRYWYEKKIVHDA